MCNTQDNTHSLRRISKPFLDSVNAERRVYGKIWAILFQRHHFRWCASRHSTYHVLGENWQALKFVPGCVCYLACCNLHGGITVQDTMIGVYDISVQCMYHRSFPPPLVITRLSDRPRPCARKALSIRGPIFEKRGLGISGQLHQSI